MKRTVDGITYNTAIARLIGEWRNTLDIQNAKWCHEILFQTKEGAYFIWGCGGSMSPYKYTGGFLRGTKTDITPLSLAEASEWTKGHLRYEVYLKEFGKYVQVA